MAVSRVQRKEPGELQFEKGRDKYILSFVILKTMKANIKLKSNGSDCFGGLLSYNLARDLKGTTKMLEAIFRLQNEPKRRKLQHRADLRRCAHIPVMSPSGSLQGFETAE